ncbi:MAG: hypothetical protein AB1792_07575 [Candidatus Zixiibacteriota bacterium]
MKRFTCLAMGILATAVSAGWAANSVVIESKAAPRGARVQLGIYVTNDVPLSGIVLPLEIRSVTPGSYIADTFCLEAAHRLDSFLTGFVVVDYLPSPDNTASWMCQGRGYAGRGAIDFNSPDAVIYAGMLSGDDDVLPPGTDGAPPGSTPSVELTFNVTATDGTFEIDTTCITYNNHIQFADDSEPGTVVGIVPAFTKGVVTIGCACDCHGDPVCDHVHTILDLNKVIGVAFRGDPPVIDPNPMCPYTDTGVNCDGVTTVIDVGKMRNVVFMGANPETEFCEPCASAP